MVFSRVEDKSHCCSYNLASVESFIEHVFLTIDECPPEEWTNTAVVGGDLNSQHEHFPVFNLKYVQEISKFSAPLFAITVGVGVVAALSMCGFGLWLYKKYWKRSARDYNLRARLNDGQAAIENPVFNNTVEAALARGQENENDRPNAYDSLSAMADVPLLDPVLPTYGTGRSARVPAIPPAATANAQLAVWNNDEGLTAAEIQDFRVLREWADHGRRYTRRYTRQKESEKEVTETSYL